MKTVRSICTGIIIAASVAFALITIFSVMAPFFSLDRNYYLIPFVYFPKLLLLAGTLGFILLCLVFKRFWALVLQCVSLISLMVFFLITAAYASPQPPPGENWLIMSMNTNKCRNDLSLLAKRVEALSPDYLCLQEVPGKITEESLAAFFPSFAWCKKRSLAVGAPAPPEFIRTITYQGVIVALVTRCRQAGQRFLLTSVHVKQPSNFRIETLMDWRLQRKKVALHIIGASRVRKWVKRQKDPLLLIGDFNAPLEADIIRRLPLNDAFSTAGRGLGLTWPSSLPILSIDHCLYNDRIDIYDYATIRLAEFSDHYGLLVRWGFR